MGTHTAICSSVQHSSLGCFFLSRFLTSLRSSGEGVLSREGVMGICGESEGLIRAVWRYWSRLDTNGVGRGSAGDSEYDVIASLMGRMSSADSIAQDL